MRNLEEATKRLPSHMLRPAVEYADQGILHSGFLRTVLENDLLHSFQHADHINQAAMLDWAWWLEVCLPMDAWGSREVVNAWIEMHETWREEAHDAATEGEK